MSAFAILADVLSHTGAVVGQKPHAAAKQQSLPRLGSAKWADHRVVKGGNAPIVAVLYEDTNTQLPLRR